MMAVMQWCCRKGDPFEGLRVGSCLTLENELSEETHTDKAKDFIGKGCRIIRFEKGLLSSHLLLGILCTKLDSFFASY